MKLQNEVKWHGRKPICPPADAITSSLVKKINNNFLNFFNKGLELKVPKDREKKTHEIYKQRPKKPKQ